MEDNNLKIKYLMIYNLLTTAHNSLVAKIKLNKDYQQKNSYIFIEDIETSSSILIYIFNDKNKLEFIKIEPKNMLVNNPEFSKDLFLSEDNIKLSQYPNKVVNLKINPIYEANSNNMTDSLYLNIECSNKGLMIEPKVKKNRLDFTKNEEDIALSLHDFFDGFNISFSLKNSETNRSENLPLEYKMNENKSSYILDAVSVTNSVNFAFIHEEILFAFYKNEDPSIDNHTMEVSLNV